MIGGLGPESSIDYYRSILARYRARKPDSGYPHLVINSLDVDRAIALLDAGRLSDLTDYLATGVKLLEQSGADFGFIAANTPHLVFDEVQRRSAISLVSIVRSASEHAKALALKRVGLLELDSLCAQIFTRKNSGGQESSWFAQKNQSGNSFTESTSVNS